MRKDKEANLIKFLRKIKLVIEQQPYEFEGYTWAALPQSSWATMLKVSVKTVGRLMLDAQIAKECTEVDGIKMAIVRPVVPGEVSTPSDRRIANTMSKIFRETTGKRPSAYDYPTYRGLVRKEQAIMAIVDVVIGKDA